MNHETLYRLIDWTREHPLANGHVLPICVWGPPGIGKTSGIEGYCHDREQATGNKFGFADYHPAHDASGADLIGSPWMNEDTHREHYAVPLWMPTAENIAIFGSVDFPENGLLLIDEPNRASQKVRNGLLQLIHEDRIAKSGYELPDGWTVILAANPPESGNAVEEMDAAFLDRMVHVWLEFDIAQWAAWARKRGLPESTVSFALQQPNMICDDTRTELPQSIHVTPSARSMEFLGTLCTDDIPHDLLVPIAQGLLGVEAGNGFVQHFESQRGSGHIHVENIPSPVVHVGHANHNAPGILEPGHIMYGQWQQPLADDVACGKVAHLHQTVDALADTLAPHQPQAEYVQQVAAFMKQTPQEITMALAEALRQKATHWYEPVGAVYNASR